MSIFYETKICEIYPLTKCVHSSKVTFIILNNTILPSGIHKTKTLNVNLILTEILQLITLVLVYKIHHHEYFRKKSNIPLLSKISYNLFYNPLNKFLYILVLYYGNNFYHFFSSLRHILQDIL